LALIAKDILEKPIDPQKIACAALYHDVSEVITGDMPSPIKYVSPEIVNMYKALEDSAKETLLSDIPQRLEASYRSFLFLTDEEERYVKAADRLSAYFKCVSELKSANSEFKNAREKILESIKAMQMEEVEIFLSMFEEAVNFDLDALAQGNVK
ncbi:MAG: 5'-deoxynucleotidase, partial [Clostridiales bacterium]|nr:5'-deoxynucleotidase [Clostridiales bacterium]